MRNIPLVFAFVVTSTFAPGAIAQQVDYARAEILLPWHAERLVSVFCKPLAKLNLTNCFFK